MDFFLPGKPRPQQVVRPARVLLPECFNRIAENIGFRFKLFKGEAGSFFFCSFFNLDEIDFFTKLMKPFDGNEAGGFCRYYGEKQSRTPMALAAGNAIFLKIKAY